MQAGREAELYGKEDVHCVLIPLRQASRQKAVHSVQFAGRPLCVQAGRRFTWPASRRVYVPRQAGGCAFLNLHVDGELLV
jgi:hypothetical protein